MYIFQPNWLIHESSLEYMEPKQANRHPQLFVLEEIKRDKQYVIKTKLGFKNT